MISLVILNPSLNAPVHAFGMIKLTEYVADIFLIDTHTVIFNGHDDFCSRLSTVISILSAAGEYFNRVGDKLSKQLFQPFVHSFENGRKREKVRHMLFFMEAYSFFEPVSKYPVRQITL